MIISMRQFLLLFVLLFCAIFACLFFTEDTRFVLIPADRWQTAKGTVVARPEGSHGSLLVRYRVGSTDFQRLFDPPPASGGDHLTVHYLETDPSISLLSDPRDLLGEKLPFLFLLSILSSGAVFGIIAKSGIVQGMRNGT
jgi:hypothetical protein